MPDSRGLGLGSGSLREKNRVAKGLALLDGHTLEFLSNETEFGLVCRFVCGQPASETIPGFTSLIALEYRG